MYLSIGIISSLAYFCEVLKWYHQFFRHKLFACLNWYHHFFRQKCFECFNCCPQSFRHICFEWLIWYHQFFRHSFFNVSIVIINSLDIHYHQSFRHKLFQCLNLLDLLNIICWTYQWKWKLIWYDVTRGGFLKFVICPLWLCIPSYPLHLQTSTPSYRQSPIVQYSLTESKQWSLHKFWLSQLVLLFLNVSFGFISSLGIHFLISQFAIRTVIYLCITYMDVSIGI